MSKKISVRVNKSIRAQLEQIAESRHVTLSHVVREALVLYTLLYSESKIARVARWILLALLPR